MEGYHPLQLGHQETFSRVGSQGSQLTASVFEGTSGHGEVLFGKKVKGTLGKTVRNVVLLLMLTMLVAAVYALIYYNALKRLSKLYSYTIIRPMLLHY